MQEKYTAVICEKPSVARDVARHLKADKKADGYLYGNSWVVTWAFGHLVELKEPGEYKPEWKSWRLDQLPMLPEQFELKAKGDKGARAQLKIIKNILKGAQAIVCATDAGREGELIYRYIADYCEVQSKPTKRLWVSSLTQEALAKGFSNLLPAKDFDPLYEAAKCRSEADWIVGLNATRYYTVTQGNGSQLWSVGRVQSPVLAMVVKRDLEIENFQSAEYWELHTVFNNALFKCSRGRIDFKKDAESLLEELKSLPFRVQSKETQQEKVLPPHLYDLTDLQKDLNRRFGLSADRTLKAAQSLYEKKHLTYPRTDSKFITKDIAKDLPRLIYKLKSIKEREISRLDIQNLAINSRMVNDLKVTDHHAILPTTILPAGSLSPDEEIVYEAVVTRLIAALYPSGIKFVIMAIGFVGDEEFKARGTLHKELGWEELYPKKEKTKVKKNSKAAQDDLESSIYEHLLKVSEGDQGAHDMAVKTLQSSAPNPYTEASLLQMMESAGRHVEDEELKEALKEKGLGTPATRASIIETLLHRKYLVRKKKQIVSTLSGRLLVSLVQDPRLKSPELTGDWEYRLKKIEKANLDASEFMKDVREFVREIIAKSATAMPTAQASSDLGACPLCEAPVLEGKRGFGCSKWKEGCRFVIWKEFNGTFLDSELASQLLKNKKSTLPVKMLIDGRPSFAYLVLNPDATLRGELCKEADPNIQKVKSAEDWMGLCPSCGGIVTETEKAFGCRNWRRGCRFKIWKTIAKRTIQPEIAKNILAHGKSKLLSGFKSKKGKDFSASLVVRGSEIKFEFSESNT